jgi:hypothetical protein
MPPEAFRGSGGLQMPNEKSLSNLNAYQGKIYSNPKITSREVLIRLCSLSGDTFTSPDVSSACGIQLTDAVGRLKKLHSWGCLKLDDPTLRRNRRYVITPWGLKMAAKWQEEMGDE